MEPPTNSVTSTWRASSDSVLLVALKTLCNQLWFCFTSCFEDIVQSGRVQCTLGEMERPWEQDHHTFSYCGAGKMAWYITSYVVLLSGTLRCIPQVTWIFSVYRQACIPRNKSDKWDILWYTTREHCIRVFIQCSGCHNQCDMLGIQWEGWV